MHNHDHPADVSKKIGLVLALNLGFALVELVGGLWTGSLYILADALHDAGDALALAMSLFLEKKAAQPRDQRYSYGYRRFSLLGALVNSVILTAGALWVIRTAIEHLQEPTSPYAPGMIALGFLGLLVNGIGYFKLKGSQNLNQKMVSLHLLEDFAGWAILLLVAVVLLFWDLPYLDPVFSILFSCYLLLEVAKNLRAAFRILLMSTPKEIDLAELESELCRHPEVLGLHDTHLWSMDGNYHILTCHLQVKPELTLAQGQVLKMEIKEMLEKRGIGHATLELETQGEVCGQENCGPRP